MSLEDSNKALVRRYVDEVWNQANSAICDELLAPNFIQHALAAPPGRDGVKAFFTLLRGGFSNISSTIEDMVAEGDTVMWSSTIRATHTGMFRGLPATGKQIEITAANIVRIANGQIVENWGEQNNLALMQQLGVIPAPPAP